MSSTSSAAKPALESELWAFRGEALRASWAYISTTDAPGSGALEFRGAKPKRSKFPFPTEPLLLQPSLLTITSSSSHSRPDLVFLTSAARERSVSSLPSSQAIIQHPEQLSSIPYRPARPLGGPFLPSHLQQLSLPLVPSTIIRRGAIPRHSRRRRKIHIPNTRTLTDLLIEPCLLQPVGCLKAVVDTVDVPSTRTMESDRPDNSAVLGSLPGVAWTRTAQGS